jgi:hypothetical protein
MLLTRLIAVRQLLRWRPEFAAVAAGGLPGSAAACIVAGAGKNIVVIEVDLSFRPGIATARTAARGWVRAVRADRVGPTALVTWVVLWALGHGVSFHHRQRQRCRSTMLKAVRAPVVGGHMLRL